MVKVLWMDDNSEQFSLFVTLVFGVILFVFTFLLHKRVMQQKERAEVSLKKAEKIKVKFKLCNMCSGVIMHFY